MCQGDTDRAPATTRIPQPKERNATTPFARLKRVCSILNLLQESVEGVSLIDVAQETELPKSSAFRYLWTLEAHRYVERDAGTGLYRLGLGFVGMQSRHLEVLRERARPWLEKIRDEFGETVNLAILDGDHIVYLDVVESNTGAFRLGTGLSRTAVCHRDGTRDRVPAARGAHPGAAPPVGDRIRDRTRLLSHRHR